MYVYVYTKFFSYRKLGIEFPFESFMSSKLLACRNVPLLGSSTVADFSWRHDLSTKSLGFKVHAFVVKRSAEPASLNAMLYIYIYIYTVSYTHMTLPKNREVYISVVAV